MIELRFTVLHLIVDCLFIVLAFYAFMCGVHYGSLYLDLYFWFIKLLLGISGIGIVLKLTVWIKSTLLFLIKNGRIYAQCCKECHSVLGAFGGISRCFKETITVTVFNKLIRQCLSEISEKIEEFEEESALTRLLSVLEQSKLYRVSKRVIIKAFDYADECILGYCYANADQENGMVECAVKAFIIFIKNSPKIFGKVVTIMTLEIFFKAAYWLCFILFCWNYVYFSIFDISVSLLNIVVCYIIGKLVSFVLEDAVFEPMLMHGVIASFKETKWDGDFTVAAEELSAKIPAFKKLCSYSTKNHNKADMSTGKEDAGLGGEKTVTSGDDMHESDRSGGI